MDAAGLRHPLLTQIRLDIARHFRVETNYLETLRAAADPTRNREGWDSSFLLSLASELSLDDRNFPKFADCSSAIMPCSPAMPEPFPSGAGSCGVASKRKTHCSCFGSPVRQPTRWSSLPRIIQTPPSFSPERATPGRSCSVVSRSPWINPRFRPVRFIMSSATVLTPMGHLLRWKLPLATGLKTPTFCFLPPWSGRERAKGKSPRPS